MYYYLSFLKIFSQKFFMCRRRIRLKRELCAVPTALIIFFNFELIKPYAPNQTPSIVFSRVRKTIRPIRSKNASMKF